MHGTKESEPIRESTVKRIIFLLAVSLFAASLMKAQENTFHINVLAYQWTTTHNALTFSWPGYANTSCNGSVNMNAYAAGAGNIYASGTASNSCSTTYTPPINQNIDVQKPVVFILADSETSRMILACTRNVVWSQCHALNPGTFLARNENGHFEVQAVSGKGKEEWIRFEVVQQTAIQPQEASAQQTTTSIEAPTSDTSNANSGFPTRWKSLNSGTVRTLRAQGDYIYAEVLLPQAATEAGMFILTDTKKDGDKYVGKINERFVKAAGGPTCTFANPIELTLVTPDRIEGRAFAPPIDARLDWNTCQYSAQADWQSFVWIPVK